jgi:hypothetical protein
MYAFLNKVNAVVVNPIITLLFAISTVYFIFAIINLIQSSKDGKDLDKAKERVLYSIIGIFIMVSVYGIINFVISSIGAPTPDYLKGKLEKK